MNAEGICARSKVGGLWSSSCWRLHHNVCALSPVVCVAS